MATTKETIRGWLNRAKANGATHMLVVCDIFDHHSDFPVEVKKGQDVRKIREDHTARGSYRVMEVYNLALDIESQLGEHRALNF